MKENLRGKCFILSSDEFDAVFSFSSMCPFWVKRKMFQFQTRKYQENFYEKCCIKKFVLVIWSQRFLEGRKYDKKNMTWNLTKFINLSGNLTFCFHFQVITSRVACWACGNQPISQPKADSQSSCLRGFQDLSILA